MLTKREKALGIIEELKELKRMIENDLFDTREDEKETLNNILYYYDYPYYIVGSTTIDEILQIINIVMEQAIDEKADKEYEDKINSLTVQEKWLLYTLSILYKNMYNEDDDYNYETVEQFYIYLKSSGYSDVVLYYMFNINGATDLMEMLERIEKYI